MGRDLSMVRRLEKIDKEIGYCEIKLEKERRLRTQLEFLHVTAAALGRVIASFEPRSGRATLESGRNLGGAALVAVCQRATLHPASAETERFRSEFRAEATLPLLIDERQGALREIADLESRLLTFQVFRAKLDGLMRDRKKALAALKGGKEPLMEMAHEFERVEQTWNTLTEDLMNIDEAIFYVSHSLDYVRSARNFILAARSEFSIESWLRSGYLVDLFKHSAVGRAKEMVVGADRNVKSAALELLCLEEVPLRTEALSAMLLPFLDELFDDLFIGLKLTRTLRFLDERTEAFMRWLKELEGRREAIFALQQEHEESRVRLFNRIGDERKRLSVAVPAQE